MDKTSKTLFKINIVLVILLIGAMVWVFTRSANIREVKRYIKIKEIETRVVTNKELLKEYEDKYLDREKGFSNEVNNIGNLDRDALIKYITE